MCFLATDPARGILTALKLAARYTCRLVGHGAAQRLTGSSTSVSMGTAIPAGAPARVSLLTHSDSAANGTAFRFHKFDFAEALPVA